MFFLWNEQKHPLVLCVTGRAHFDKQVITDCSETNCVSLRILFVRNFSAVTKQQQLHATDPRTP